MLVSEANRISLVETMKDRVRLSSEFSKTTRRGEEKMNAVLHSFYASRWLAPKPELGGRHNHPGELEKY